MGSLPRTEEEPNEFMKENSPDANSIPLLTGRIGKPSFKKRGLSRHYPNKAQSFECIASLLDQSQFGESSVVLSKSVSMRCMPGRGVGALRRCSTTATLSEHSTVSEDSVTNNWPSMEEQTLCSAMQATNLQEPTFPQPQLPMGPA